MMPEVDQFDERGGSEGSHCLLRFGRRPQTQGLPFGQKLEIELVSPIRRGWKPQEANGRRKVIKAIGRMAVRFRDYRINWRVEIPPGESSKFCILPTNTRGRPSPRKSKKTESFRSTNNLVVGSPLHVQFLKFDGILDRILKFLVEGNTVSVSTFPLFW